MMFRVVIFKVRQAFYDLRALLGSNVVLLNDPRWENEPDPLHIELDEYGLF